MGVSWTGPNSARGADAYQGWLLLLTFLAYNNIFYLYRSRGWSFCRFCWQRLRTIFWHEIKQTNRRGVTFKSCQWEYNQNSGGSSERLRQDWAAVLQRRSDFLIRKHFYKVPSIRKNNPSEGEHSDQIYGANFWDENGKISFCSILKISYYFSIIRWAATFVSIGVTRGSASRA